MKLTVKSTAGMKLPAGKDDHFEFDDEIPGFGLRIREGGSRTLVFQYKLGAKQRRMTLGKLTAVNLDNARKKAKIYSGRVADGLDPAADKEEAKSQAANTFEATVKDFLTWQRTRTRKNGTVGLRPRSLLEIERYLLVHAKPLHKLRLAKISRTDIANCLAAVEKKSGPVAKNRGRSSLSALFSWAMQEGKADSNPVALTRKNEEKNRDRVLKPEEMRIIWSALEDDQYGAIVRLLALTGQRRDEIAGLRWSEISDSTILLPLERTKNGRAHSVPLSAAAQRIIAKQPRRSNADGRQRDLIFGFSEGPFSGWSTRKERLDQRIAKIQGKPLAAWRLHDLRRTAATGMADIGIQPHIIEAVLNHVSGHKGGVAGIYNRSTYEPEKRDTLKRWAEHLMAIVEGSKSKVVPLRQPA
jgi:integrase